MDLKKYIYGHCIDPVKTWIYDSYTKQHVSRLLPCGRCLHCRNTYINEWVTRLFAQYYDSKFCYFVSLDYKPFDTSSVALRLARETAACYHDINKLHHYGLHPLILNKSHLQKFYKRLRKNLGFSIQYFACGEYGTHANGKGYGRPHFHMIVFSNQAISKDDFVKAWTLDNYVIGRVDYDDMKSPFNTESNVLKSFKYVCKYIIKQNFDFEKLATINFHRGYFKSLQYAIEEAQTLFPYSVPIEDRQLLEQGWREYIKMYSPFIVCSRRPSIGVAYFERSKARFTEGDFTLFGLSKECVAFPRYYLRKTKESLCDVVVVSETNGKPTTSSRISYVASLLRAIQDERTDFSRFDSTFKNNWCVINNKFVQRSEGDEVILPVNSFHVYDKKNKIFFQFNGYYYTLWHKVNSKLGFVRVRTMDIYEACDLFESRFEKYYLKYVRPMYFRRILQEKELHDTIEFSFAGNCYNDKYETFQALIQKYYKIELDSIYKKNLYMQNSKQNL